MGKKRLNNIKKLLLEGDCNGQTVKYTIDEIKIILGALEEEIKVSDRSTYYKEYYQANKDKLDSKTYNYYHNNKEKVKAIQKKSILRNCKNV